MAPQTTTTLRDAAALDAEVVTLRTQAGALHAARANATQANDSKWGGLRDDAARDADAARHAATRANAQALEQQESAKGYLSTARAYEVTANEAAAAGDHARAAELREDAQRERSLAVSADERATRAHKAGAEQAARADKLDQEVREYDQRITAEGDEQTPAIERVADQLDEKATLLAEAADAQRLATRYQAQGDTAGAARATQSATDALARADAIQPAFVDVPAAVLYDAGITQAGSPEPASEALAFNSESVGDEIDPDADVIDPTEPSDPFATETGTTDATADQVAATDDPGDASTFDQGVDTFASADGGPMSPSAFDEPVTVDSDVQDFGASADPIDTTRTDVTSFEFEA